MVEEQSIISYWNTLTPRGGLTWILNTMNTTHTDIQGSYAAIWVVHVLSISVASFSKQLGRLVIAIITSSWRFGAIEYWMMGICCRDSFWLSARARFCFLMSEIEIFAAAQSPFICHLPAAFVHADNVVKALLHSLPGVWNSTVSKREVMELGRFYIPSGLFMSIFWSFRMALSKHKWLVGEMTKYLTEAIHGREAFFFIRLLLTKTWIWT